jgi:Ribulose bisphosphate carboxylase, small chain
MCPSHRFFETFSYLPPLSDGEIAKQVDYIVKNGFIACLEFADSEFAYVGSQNMGERSRFKLPHCCIAFILIFLRVCIPTIRAAKWFGEFLGSFLHVV